MAEQDVAKELQTLVKSKYPAIAIQSKEERRVERVIRAVAKSLAVQLPSGTKLPEYKVVYWSVTTGFVDGDGESIQNTRNLEEGLEWMRGYAERCIFVVRDPWAYLTGAECARARRQVRDTAQYFKKTEATTARVMILLSPELEVAKDLEGDVHVLEWPLPGREELGVVLQQTLKGLDPSLKKEMGPVDADLVVTAALGLTAEDAYSSFARSIVAKRTLDPALIAEEKKQMIARSGALEVLEPLAGGFDDVAGLEILKGDLADLRLAYSAEGRKYGLPLPKGVFLFGAQGCGKTLIAQALAGEWHLQAIRFSPANLFGGILGETEKNFREVRKIFKAVGRAIVLVDELEKAVGDGDRDGSTSQRLKGELLTWLQFRDGAELFLIGTANDVEKITLSSPELIRKGRWTELYYVSLPHDEERERAFQVHMRKRKGPAYPDPAAVDLKPLVAATQGWSGAEIEAVVEAAMFSGFKAKRAVDVEDLFVQIRNTMPLSKTAGESLAWMDKWRKGRAKEASRRMARRPDTPGALEVA